MFDVIKAIHEWTGKRLMARDISRWGMTRECPWCGQRVETGGKHKVRPAEHCEFFDTFTCGVCGGESHWEFGPVPFPRGIGNPPPPAQWAIDADMETRQALNHVRQA